MKYKALYLFAGIGGGAIGFQKAKCEYKGLLGQFETMAGIDCDPLACEDFENLTGAPGIQMDLFSRQDYISFHGQEPPLDWKEITPWDLYRAANYDYPDVVFLSPPCKGFSGLLPAAAAASEKYQALNNLVVRSMELTMQAFEENLPSCILIENVPRITTRGKHLLKRVKKVLAKYGYVFDEAYHDCGEIGGLGQHRKRYLLMARNEAKMPSFIYKPYVQACKTIGDVLSPMPLPGASEAGIMHKLPNLKWKTWVRLALIPAGGDWRDLQNIDYKQYGIRHEPRACSFGVMDWEKTSSTITGNMRVGGSSASAISDPRVNFGPNTHTAIYKVVKFDKTANTVTGANGPNNGAICIADPRTCKARSGTYGIMEWDKPSKTIIGSADVHAGSVAFNDPRFTFGKESEISASTQTVPKDTDAGNWMIIALDGTWHRPLTTLELAALQSFPLTMPDGSPLQLAGKKDARWREAIGNAVPPDAAQAIAEQILPSLMAASTGEWLMGATEIWVMPQEEEKEEVFHQN